MLNVSKYRLSMWHRTCRHYDYFRFIKSCNAFQIRNKYYWLSYESQISFSKRQKRKIFLRDKTKIHRNNNWKKVPCDIGEPWYLRGYIVVGLGFKYNKTEVMMVCCPIKLSINLNIKFLIKHIKIRIFTVNFMAWLWPVIFAGKPKINDILSTYYLFLNSVILSNWQWITQLVICGS